MPSLRLSFEVARPVGEVFEWHRDTRNAALISPPSIRVVSVQGRFPLQRGDEVRLVVAPRGLPARQRWLIVIEELVEPELIVDRMLEGPFRSWRHEHLFEDLGGGRTRVIDRVEYRLPRLLAWAGPLAHREIARTFAHRHRRSRDLLESRRNADTSP
jgi:ligand-binding SRPBCC domain-containing protein